MFCTDVDGEVAKVALGSAFVNVVMPLATGGCSHELSAGSNERCPADTVIKSASLDWFKPSEWPHGLYDVALASIRCAI